MIFMGENAKCLKDFQISFFNQQTTMSIVTIFIDWISVFDGGLGHIFFVLFHDSDYLEQFLAIRGISVKGVGP